MRRLFFLSVAAAALALLIVSATRATPKPAGVPEASWGNAGEAIGCAPSGSEPIGFDNSDRKMVPLGGWGRHGWKIATSSDSAQFYFNQGLNLFYSFHLEESLGSFLEAQRHDSACAMAYWGEVMARGPIINAPGYWHNDPALIRLLTKAESLTDSKREQALIRALRARYSSETTIAATALAGAYRDALKAVHEQYPDDIEIAVLYADALMLIHPRDWYEPDGREKEGTAAIGDLLENILQKAPDHPAALHYYIHLIEPSTRPERAAAAADRLLPLLPSVAHMVHMPSHIYIRTGDFAKGIRSNEAALAGYANYQKTLGGWKGNRYLYYFHNADMLGANAALMGDYRGARKAYAGILAALTPADSVFYRTPAFTNVIQFTTAQAYLLDVQFGNWGQVLRSKGPLTGGAYHRLLWQFGQGMALARTGNPGAAERWLAALRETMRDSSLAYRRPNRNRGIDAATIASVLLEGVIAEEQGRHEEAIRLFASAVALEDGLRYSEPEDWRLPARWFLGDAYLKKGDREAAALVFRQDLADHPSNYRATAGLKQALQKQ